jgi:hypothetical protein
MGLNLKVTVVQMLLLFSIEVGVMCAGNTTIKRLYSACQELGLLDFLFNKKPAAIQPNNTY